MPRWIFCLMVILPLCACEDGRDEPRTPAALPGKEWKLVALSDQGKPVAGADRVGATLRFEEKGQAGGRNGCNGYGGDFTATDGGSLRFGPLMQTQIACDEPAATVEAVFMRLLTAASRWEVQAGMLRITSADGRLVGEYR
jgi:heat shock protein HslJ